MIIGFLVIFFSASAGPFLSYYVLDGFILDEKILSSWELWLLRSAHAHTALFGLLQVVFGLTLPYSRISNSFKNWQTIGITCGILAMAIVLPLKSFIIPSNEIHIIDIVFGTLISLFYLAIATHVMGLVMRKNLG